MDITTCVADVWMQDEAKWMELLQNEDEWNKIPLLNVNALHHLQNSSLVRFRGMVQDMYSPEYYFEELEIYNKETKQKRVVSGKYRDITVCNNEESLEIKNDNKLSGERQTFVVISDPALNEWVKLIEHEKHNIKFEPSLKRAVSQKRSLTEEETMEVDSSGNASSSANPTSSTTNQSENMQKKQRTSENTSQQPQENSNVISTEYLLNFPIPDRIGKSCHVKLYKDANTIKLNNVYEFVGFLSVDPYMVEMHNDDDDDNHMEVQAHHPPPSLIPRLHCVSFKQLEHFNPLLCDGGLSPEKINAVRKELLILLTQLLLGDQLAAEYVIFHLISEVYMRKDFFTLGKFSVNLSSIPFFFDVDYVIEVYQFIQMIVTKSHYFPMTLENMNELAFVPKKDNECNRLTSGMLQLSANTHFVLDETKLEAGRLNGAGVNAVKAIAGVVKHQKINYDFTYYNFEFDCDIPFLIFSEGKSMLPADYHVVLEPDKMCMDTFNEILAAAKHFLKPELLNDIRRYITLCRMIKYEIPEALQKVVENDFVNMRQTESLTVDDFHQLLVLSKFVCVSEGKTHLDEECWKKACQLEKDRKSRITQK